MLHVCMKRLKFCDGRTNKVILGVGCMMHAQYIYDPGPWSWCMHVGMMHVSMMNDEFCSRRTNKAIQGVGYLFWFLKCLLKSLALKDENSQWQHSINFSSEWNFNFFFQIASLNSDAQSHLLQFYNFSPEWGFKCILKVSASTEA